MCVCVRSLSGMCVCVCEVLEQHICVCVCARVCLNGCGRVINDYVNVGEVDLPLLTPQITADEGLLLLFLSRK